LAELLEHRQELQLVHEGFDKPHSTPRNIPFYIAYNDPTTTPGKKKKKRKLQIWSRGRRASLAWTNRHTRYIYQISLVTLATITTAHRTYIIF
jgi:hypothetical protein